MSGQTFRIGCLGAGYFSGFHLDGWSRIAGAEIVGIANRDVKKAEATGYPAFGTLADLLANTKPDIVDIITPPESHFTAIKSALEFGVKAIICQKPFCASLEEARQAAEMAAKTATPLIVHENFRFQPWYRAIAKAVQSGKIGDVHQLTFRMRTGDGQGTDAYLARQPYFQKMERFLVHETAVHWVDVFRYLLGDIKAVYADLRKMNPVIAGEDAGYIVFDFENNVRAVFDGNRHLDHSTANPRLTFGEALIEGTTGSLTLLGDGSVHHRSFGEVSTTPVLAAKEWPGFAGDCVHALQSHVVAALKGDGEFENSAADYLRVREIEDAIYQSASSGRKLEV